MSTREAFEKRFGLEPKFGIAAGFHYTDRDLWLACLDSWQAAVEAERERCAQIAEGFGSHKRRTPLIKRGQLIATIAAAIRAREDKKA